MGAKTSIMFDYSKLCGRMVEKNYTRTRLASKLGISRQHLGEILNEGKPLTSIMILRMAQILEIVDELTPYFFTLKVQKS